MGLLNDIKQEWKKLNAPPVLRISMMGARGVGKTSVLTSIFKESQETIAGSSIFWKADNDTAGKLNALKLALMNAFETRNPSNLPASSVQSEYRFKVGMDGKEKVEIRIKDFPGEYLVGNEDNQKAVSSFIDESQVIVVAIDTPYLMEEGGRYNEQKNEVQTIFRFLKENPELFKNKLIMLVPLKCAKYFHNNTIHQVSDKVAELYAPLREYFKANNIASVITPIQTLGDIDFTRMTTNPYAGEVEKLAEYEFRGEHPKYAPLYCAQPFYYLLTYSINYFEWQNNHPSGSILEKIWARFIHNDKNFYFEALKLKKYILEDGRIFRTLTKNDILKNN